MKLEFVNREKELALLEKHFHKRGLLIVYGRRRVGKTALIKRWTQKRGGMYSQAIEAYPAVQIQQIYLDIKAQLGSEIVPKSWGEMFELIDRVKGPLVFCIDEFPYLVEADDSVSSLFQKWIDHTKKRDLILILCGSSQRTMLREFLSPGAPLYGRAERVIRLEPMDYFSFCSITGCSVKEIESFVKFSLVGGIPKYWSFVNSSVTTERLAEELYFDSGALLENEPRRLLIDENVNGLLPWSVLELIGRGVNRISEVAARMEVKQGQLSKVLELLIEVSLINRQVSFGERMQNSKKTLYKLFDPMLMFWFGVYSPFRSRWFSLSSKERRQLLYLHASRVFEDIIRQGVIGAHRYWDNHLELDLVFEERDSKRLCVGEVKFTKLTSKEIQQAKAELATRLKIHSPRWLKTDPHLEIFDWISYLKRH